MKQYSYSEILKTRDIELLKSEVFLILLKEKL